MVRIVEWNLGQQKTTGEYVYLVDGKNESDKIGDTVALNAKQLLILEQNGKRGSKEANQKIYKVDLMGATNIYKLDESRFGKALEAMKPKELRKNGVRAVQKKLYMNLSSLGLYDFEKLEGLSLLDDGTIVLVNDNDFGVEGSFDPKTGKLTPSPSPLVTKVIWIKPKVGPH